MNADCAFYTGKTHAVCQDYARSKSGDFPYAILADGCSGSTDTDTGARLLVLAAERALAMTPATDFDSEFYTRVISMARVMADSARLPVESLDATLLLAAYLPSSFDPNGSCTEQVLQCLGGEESAKHPVLLASMYGDGVIAYKDKNLDKIIIHQITYPSGYPAYVNYIVGEGRAREWYNLTHREPKPVDLLTYCCDPTTWKPDEIVPQHVKHTTVAISRQKFVIGDIEWIALMSDGVLSFAEKSIEPGKSNRQIPLLEVLKDLLDFKNFKGPFVQRQVGWFERQLQKKNWQHDDDLSVASIYLG